MDKKPCKSQDVEVRKGPWTMEEDLILINYIANHGEGVWNSLAKAAGLKRTGKSCRLRWLNYLRPDVRRGNITPEEQLLIMELHAKWGNRWSKIAKHLPGRTDNEIKNYWRTRIQKHMKQADQMCNHNQSNISDHHHHQLASTSTISTGQMANCGATTSVDFMEAYSPPSSSFNHNSSCNMDHAFPGQQPMSMSISMAVDQSNDTYWSMEEDIWSMQLLNCD